MKTIKRLRYAFIMLPLMGVAAIDGLMTQALSSGVMFSNGGFVVYFAVTLLTVAWGIWGLFVTSWRLRDAGWSQFGLITYFVPPINTLMVIALCVVPTEE